MDRNNELFTPDSIDDDIDFLMDESHSIFPDLNAQFLHELRSISKDDAASLKRVWERLEHYSKQQDTLQEPSLQTPQRQGHILPLQSWRKNKQRISTRSLFTVLAAALTGLFLVSSLGWILTMSYPATPAAPRTVQSPPAIGRSLLQQNTSTPLQTSSRVTPRSGEIYTIVSNSSDKLLEVANGQWNGAGVALSSSTGCACQTWAFCSTNDPNYPGSFYLYNMDASPGPQASNDHVLGVADLSPKSQIGLAQFVPALKPNLYWLLQPTSDGYYNLINARDKAYADVFLGSQYDLAAVMLYWPNGKTDEEWQLSDTGQPFTCPVVK
jgi:hypothetical protein